MAIDPPTSIPLRLFDVSQFEFAAEFAAEPGAKTPPRWQPALPPDAAPDVAPDVAMTIAKAAHRVRPSPQLAQARRRRARARLARRRYTADSESYERLDQLRRSLCLVGDSGGS